MEVRLSDHDGHSTPAAVPELPVEPLLTEEALTELSQPQLLGHLTLVLDHIRELQEEADRVVRASRAAGASWAQIAGAAGMRPQSAHQRWSEQGRERHRDYQRQQRSRTDQIS